MNPATDDVYDMSLRLRDMIRAAQADEAVKTLRSSIRAFANAFDRVRETEALIDAATNHKEPV
ncbi:hypothetical protein D3C87_2026020 [compost metagenome]